jgi:outer membrane protein OmpA-like peptidoglycan-associated protein
MTRALSPLARVATACGLAAAVIASTASCSTQTRTPEEQLLPYASAVPRTTPRVVQVGYGREAFFAVCAEPSCGAATPKTLPGTASAPVKPPAAAHRIAPLVAPLVAPPVTAPVAAPVATSAATSAAAGTPAVAVPAPSVTPAAPPTTPVPKDGPPPPAAPPPVSTLQPEPSTRIVVAFAFGSAHLGDAARHAIRTALPRARASERIVISGRTDGSGPDEVNQRLALARALAVRDYIRDVVPDLPNVIAIDARGSCCFVADNDSARGRRQNRRVEVDFVDAGAM